MLDIHVPRSSRETGIWSRNAEVVATATATVTEACRTSHRRNSASEATRPGAELGLCLLIRWSVEAGEAADRQRDAQQRPAADDTKQQTDACSTVRDGVG
jgi:hypothetical protein